MVYTSWITYICSSLLILILYLPQYIYLSTGFVLDWKTARLKCIMPLCFLFAILLVVSAQPDFELLFYQTIYCSQCNVNKYAMQADAEMHLHTEAYYCHENLPRLVCWRMKDTWSRLGCPSYLSHGHFDQLISSRTADMLLIQHYCGKHNQYGCLDSALNTRDWEHHALINSVSFICRVVADLICLNCIEFDKSYHFPLFSKEVLAYLISNK